MSKISKIAQKNQLTTEDLAYLLNSNGKQKKLLYEISSQIKLKEVGNKTYFRGLIEASNICAKDCYYCGIRKSNKAAQRYNLTDQEILDAARFAYENNYGSLVIQTGEIASDQFTHRIEKLLKAIKKLSNDQLGITLSLGEQSFNVYKRWFDAGAHRYLLRIETSNEELYKKLHPEDHSFSTRVTCLENLKKAGYQTGTGVMIGLPRQTITDLANDLLFMQELDIDMVGMGPYIEHSETPLFDFTDNLWPLQQRFDMALKMIATLRILMKDINIAAATALQAIDPLGREKAIKVGANIIMPNITPSFYRNNYDLYENKPCVDEEPDQCQGCLDARLTLAESEIGYGEWGDSKHFYKKICK